MKKIKTSILLLLIFTGFISYGQVNVNFFSINSNTSNAIVDMYFSTDSVGFYLTNIGEIFQTIDGGNNWNIKHTDSDFTTTDLTVYNQHVSIVSTSDSVFCYASSFSQTQCYRLRSSITNLNFEKDTLNYRVLAPEAWNNEVWDKTRVNDSISNYFSQFYGIYELEVNGTMISGSDDKRVFYSADSGNTWEMRQFTNSPLSSDPYQSAVFGDTMYAITNYSTHNYISHDNGITWGIHSLPEAFFIIFKDYLLGFSLADGKDFYVITPDGNILFQDSLQNDIINLYMKTENEGFILGKNGMLVKVTTNIVLSTSEINSSGLKKKINIYPNPAKDVLQIEILEDIKIDRIELFDINGKRIKVFGKNEMSLNVSGLISGAYFLKISTKQGKITEKVIIE